MVVAVAGFFRQPDTCDLDVDCLLLFSLLCSFADSSLDCCRRPLSTVGPMMHVREKPLRLETGLCSCLADVDGIAFVATVGFFGPSGDLRRMSWFALGASSRLEASIGEECNLEVFFSCSRCFIFDTNFSRDSSYIRSKAALSLETITFDCSVWQTIAAVLRCLTLSLACFLI